MDSMTNAVPAARGKLGVLVGMDGSGKSTVLRSLREQGCIVADWKDLRSHEEVAFWAPQRPREVRAKLKPMSRAMFVASHLVAEYEYVIEPALSMGQNVLADSYYFKWLAKESIYEQTHAIFYTVCDALPKPDLVIVLELSPELAFRRKIVGLSPFEYFEQPTLADFAQFQRNVMGVILEKARDMPVVSIDATQDILVVEQQILHELAHWGWRMPGVPAQLDTH
jgi:thymidylate kinase